MKGPCEDQKRRIYTYVCTSSLTVNRNCNEYDDDDGSKRNVTRNIYVTENLKILNYVCFVCASIYISTTSTPLL